MIPWALGAVFGGKWQCSRASLDSKDVARTNYSQTCRLVLPLFATLPPPPLPRLGVVCVGVGEGVARSAGCNRESRVFCNENNCC